jgi:hypothetical protein
MIWLLLFICLLIPNDLYFQDQDISDQRINYLADKNEEVTITIGSSLEINIENCNVEILPYTGTNT